MIEKQMFPEYYKLLDLEDGSTVDEIKRAYRKKAREFHPDLNHSFDAMDMFIRITEAYEFLLIHHRSAASENESFNTVIEDWNLYKKDIARRRAQKFAQASYIQFKNTRFYKTTRIFDGTTIIFGLIIAILVIVFDIYGYIWRLKHLNSISEKPPIGSFLVLLLLGVVFLVISLSFLWDYYLSSKLYKTKHPG